MSVKGKVTNEKNWGQQKSPEYVKCYISKVTENSPWELTLLQLLISLIFKFHANAQHQENTHYWVQNEGTEKGTTKAIIFNLELAEDVMNSCKDTQCMNTMWGVREALRTPGREDVCLSLELGTSSIIYSDSAHQRQEKGLIIRCDEVIRKEITEKAEEGKNEQKLDSLKQIAEWNY